METLREMLELARRDAYESDHVGGTHEAEEMVGSIIRDYVAHRERVNDFHARPAPSGLRMGGDPQPSGVTPLTSP